MHPTLNAVLAADIVGYSRQMNEDAAETLTTLKRLRTEILVPLVAARHGRLVKNMGDGWIVTFESVTDAVECAMQVQDRLKIDGAMQLRTGIHIGDVVAEDDDVFGEGVNVAARLQQMAEPGAVAISDPVHALLDGTLRPSFDDAGEQSLKNISRPVRVWTRGGEIAGGAAALAKSEMPRLAINSVQTSDPRPEMRDLASALTGELAFHLDSQRQLSARTVQDPAADIGSYSLSPVLRAAGERVRFEADLRSPEGDRVTLVKDDGSLDDVFDWQDRAGLSVSRQVFKAIQRAEANRIEAIPEAQRSAQEWMQLAQFRGGSDLDGCVAFLQSCDHALALQPDNSFFAAEALTMLTGAISIGYQDHLQGYLEYAPGWIEQIDKSEPPTSPTRIMLAVGNLMRTGDADAARSDVRKLTRNLPFDPELLFWTGWLYLYLGEPRPALEHFRRLLDGLYPDAYESATLAGVGLAFVQSRQPEEALPYLDAAIELTPDFPGAMRNKLSACGHLGLEEEARRLLVRLEALVPGETISSLFTRSGYIMTEATQYYFEGLKKAGLPEKADSGLVGALQ